MKQETGNNHRKSAQKVSIRLAPGGHSFSTEELTAAAAQQTDEVWIEVLTSHTMLIPEEVFSPDATDEVMCSTAGRELLSANGTPLADSECAVWSPVTDGIAAVMTANTETVQKICTILGERARFTSPLLHTPQAAEASVWMHHSYGLLYIKVYDTKLRIAEVIPVSTETDILYFAELLGREFPLEKRSLHLTASSKPLRKLLGSRFKKVEIEHLK